MTFAALTKLIERFSRQGVPKYIALRDAIAYSISTGEIKLGEKLPSEQELATHLPLSLGTIQKTLKLLSDERLITRKSGYGSYVNSNETEAMSTPFHCRFVDDDKKKYVITYPQIIKREKINAKGKWSEHLQSLNLICIERIISINHEFKVYTKFFVDIKRLPVFDSLPEKKISNQNFKEVIFKETGKTISRIDLFVSLSHIDSNIGKLIGIPKSSLVMTFSANAYLGNSDPIYYQEIFIPKSKRALHISVDGANLGLNS